jgi:hypothetical protein
MHFHIPKPLHGWRAFAGEVGIIVIGVLIALGAEQLVETWRWHEKVRAAEQNLDFEVNVQLDNAEEAVALKPCAGPFIDALELKIKNHDGNAIQRLYDAQPPFTPRNWRSTAWQTTLSTDVADHMNPTEMAQYGFIYTGAEDNRAIQSRIATDLGEAMVGRLKGPDDAVSVALQLAAAERLRMDFQALDLMSDGLLEVARGGVHAGWKVIHRNRSPHLSTIIRKELASCEQSVKSLS